jgi:hypothetical protein
MARPVVVNVIWDAETKVWIAKSDGVPGFAIGGDVLVPYLNCSLRMAFLSALRDCFSKSRRNAPNMECCCLTAESCTPRVKAIQVDWSVSSFPRLAWVRRSQLTPSAHPAPPPPPRAPPAPRRAPSPSAPGSPAAGSTRRGSRPPSCRPPAAPGPWRGSARAPCN